MNCIVCGTQIVDDKRMCDSCAKDWTQDLLGDIKAAAEEKKPKKVLPDEAPRDTVRSWKPQSEKKEAAIKGSLPPAASDANHSPRTW